MSLRALNFDITMTKIEGGNAGKIDIKKTLLHEIAHIVHSEHDANLYELDK